MPLLHRPTASARERGNVTAMSIVVVGYVPKPEGEAALVRAIEEAQLRGAELIVVNSQHGGSADAEPDADIAGATACSTHPASSYEVRQLARGFEAAEDLVSVAESNDAELIVIGLRRRTPVGQADPGLQRPAGAPRRTLPGAGRQGLTLTSAAGPALLPAGAGRLPSTARPSGPLLRERSAMSSQVLSARDLEFLLHEWLDVDRPARPASGTPSTPARRSTPCWTWPRPWRLRHFAPHNKRNDAEEPTFDGERVHIHPEVGAALDVYARSGFVGATFDEDLGGLQLPYVVASAVARLVPGGQLRHRRLPVPHPGQRQPAGRPRLARAGRALRRADAGGPVLRHHVPLRAAGRVVAGRRHHDRAPAGRRHLPAHRQQDVDLRRRPRAQREHRPPGAGPHRRRARRRQGDLAVPGPEAPGRRRRLVGERNDVVLAGLNHKMGWRGTTNTLLNFGEGAHTPGREAGRGRLPGRRAAPRAGADVPHDERGPDRRRPGRGRARLHRLPQGARLRPDRTQGRPVGSKDPSAPPVRDHRARRRAPDAARA